MWWSKTLLNGSRPRGAILAGLLVSALALSGCGFQPLYARDADSGQAVTDQLAQIRIQPLRDRVGQQMHNFLRDRLNPLGQPATPGYVLQVRLKETTTDLGVRSDATATRANLTMTADYKLLAMPGLKTLMKSRSRSTNSYDILTDEFATLNAENDARERALLQISEEVKLRLSIYFSKPPEEAAAQ